MVSMVNSIPSDAESGGRWFESQMSQLFRPYSIKTCLRHLALEGKTGSCNSRCKIYQLIPFYYKQVFPCSINKLLKLCLQPSFLPLMGTKINFLLISQAIFVFFMRISLESV